MRKLLFALALVVAAGCYPVDPTPVECAREIWPPTCGCPRPDGGFYTPGVDVCAPRR